MHQNTVLIIDRNLYRLKEVDLFKTKKRKKKQNSGITRKQRNVMLNNPITITWETLVAVLFKKL